MKTTRIILATFLAAVLALAGYLLFRRPETPVYRGRGGEYSLSLFNHRGERVSRQRGRLRLLLDPFTVYRNCPDQGHGNYTIDGDGFRGGYRDAGAPALAMVVGGSAAFGQGLEEDDQTFASLLSRDNPEYDVVNAAVVGFLSGQELAGMVHRLDSFRPDLYIVFNGWNDIFDPLTYAGEWPVRSAPIGFNNTFLVIGERLRESFEREHGPAEGAAFPEPFPPLAEGEYFQEIVRTYIENVARMADFARSRGAGFLVVFQPEAGNKKARSEREERYLRRWERSYGYLGKGIPDRYRELIAAAQESFRKNNIPYLDINQAPEFSENPETLFYDVVHPNPAGHAVIAELINNSLKN